MIVCCRSGCGLSYRSPTASVSASAVSDISWSISARCTRSCGQSLAMTLPVGCHVTDSPLEKLTTCWLPFSEYVATTRLYVTSGSGAERPLAERDRLHSSLWSLSRHTHFPALIPLTVVPLS